ncbi:MAG: InlB B-repeat-containing protein [Clostridia bacterium]|nr:InlB B-repeat-containing protein [Clostridia bacterium]
MKRMRKSLLTCILLVLSMVCLISGACADPKVKLSFESEGQQIEIVELEKGTEYTLTPPEERVGFSFEGWYLDAEFTDGPVTTVTAEKNVTLYAKWEQKYRVTLNLGGGSLSAPDIWLKAGENVYNAVQDYAPTKANNEFGMWMNGNAELSRGYSMPKQDITLTARYKVGYTVNTYYQNLAQSGYDQGEAIKGFAYPGAFYPEDITVTGFTQIDPAEAWTINENYAQNTFSLYFDRAEYTVTFDANYPQGFGQDSFTQTYVYGAEAEIPSDLFTLPGYVLTGWANAAGEVQYDSGYINSRLFNEKVNDTAPKTFTVKGNTRLYGVWVQGYTDVFAGQDYVYIIGNKAYLERGDRFFSGTYNATRKEFEFLDSRDRILLSGVLNEADRTFIYYDDDRASYVAVRYITGVGLTEDTIYFDEYNGITYEAYEGGSRAVSEGTYYVNENGYYIVTFTKGNLNGQTLTFITGTVTDGEGNARNAFQIRNDEEYNWGALKYFFMQGSAIYTSNVYIALNGFGTAAFYNGSTTTEYIYTREENIVTLRNMSSGAVYLIMKVVNLGGTNGFMIYDESFDHTYEAENGATLKLDGLYQATYKLGNTVLEGTYSTTSSVLGGNVVRFFTEGGERVFIINSETFVDPETQENITTYSFVERAVGYAEYYYSDSQSVWFTILLVINETKVGEATIYGRTEAGESVPVAYGTYDYDEENDRYIFTAEKWEETEAAIEPFDITTIKTFVFNTGVFSNGSTTYNLMYWFSMTPTEGETSYYDVRYTSVNGNETLVLIGIFAVYTDASGNVITGRYSVTENIMIVSGEAGTVYLEINEQESKFITLTGNLGYYYLIDEQGMETENYIYFDGKGNATYTVVTTNAEGGKETASYTGTAVETDETTDYDYPIYEFRAEGVAPFRFISLVTSSAGYIMVYNDVYNGTYYEEEGIGMLMLDGFGFQAAYYDDNGNVFAGMYVIAEDNVIVMIMDSGERYFDITGKEAFTARGTEFATYLVYDNQGVDNRVVEFDGYGNAKIYKMVEDASGEMQEEIISENATYVALDNGYTFTVTYKIGNEVYTLTGTRGYLQMGSYVYNAFIVAHEEVVANYIVESDWSVLSLDSYGNAIRYDTLGQGEAGRYFIITETMLYYANNSGTDAAIFIFDRVAGTAVQMKFTPRGYYTKDLESLRFTEYGFMIYNGETRYYYTVEADGNVLVYHQDPTNPKANRYGFVEDEFGSFDATMIEFEGKEYYANSGYMIIFGRDSEGADKYPISVAETETDQDGNPIQVIKKYPLENLQFTPAGSMEFSVSGVVTFNRTAQACTVTRTMLADGTYEMYFTVGNIRFYISVDYTGEEDEYGVSTSTYQITGMSAVQAFASDYYYTLYIQYLLMIGVQVGNVIGEIAIIQDFNEAGDVVRSYIKGAFAPMSGMFDSEGNLMESIEANFTQDAESGLFTAEFEWKDGYTYRMYFTITPNMYIYMYLGSIVYGYSLQALVRVQTLEMGEYKLEMEQIVASDSYAPGGFYTIKLYKGEDLLELDSGYIIDGVIYYIVREKDEDGNAISTKYYVIELTAEEVKLPEGDEDAVEYVPAYESVIVTEVNVKTLYTAEGDFVDIMEAENKILFLAINGGVYLVTACEYDATTQTYTLTVGNRTYTVKEEEGKAIVEEVVEPSEEEEEEQE